MAKDPRWTELPRKGPLGWALTVAAAGGGVGSFLVWAGGLSARLERRALAQGGQAVRGLAPGSLPGLGLRDASDHQWRNFRGGLPQLCLVLLAWAALGRLERLGTVPAALGRLARAKLMWGFLFFLHGSGAVFVVALALGGFLAARAGAALEKKHARAGLCLVWVYNLATLMAVFMAPAGFWSFRTVHRGLAFLDSWRGMVGFMQSYRIQILRQISFGVDCIWADGTLQGLRRAARDRGPALFELQPTASIQDREEKDYKFRSQVGGAEAPSGFAGGGTGRWGSVWEYLGYMFYPPLYLTGPIMSYNAFQSYRTWPQKVYSARDLLGYGAFVFGLCGVLEVWNHIIFASLFTTNEMWQWKNAPGLGIGSKEIMAMSFLVLAFMWAKFTVIWGIARFFALLDGVAPPENMRRFFADNHTVTEFWKNWHASFNRWLVRYLYVPLGGDKNRLLNVWVIFTFVAVWHEINVRLIGWGWVMALFLGPEIVAQKIAAGEWAQRSRSKVWYRELAAAAATVNIIVLIFGNLIGFQIGIDGARAFLSDIFGRELWLAVFYTTCFYGVVHLQFGKRRLEVLGRPDSKRE